MWVLIFLTSISLTTFLNVKARVEEIKRSYQQLSEDVSGLVLLLLKHVSLLKTTINWGNYIDQLWERREGSKGNKSEGSCMGRQLDKRNKNIEQKWEVSNRRGSLFPSLPLFSSPSLPPAPFLSLIFHLLDFLVTFEASKPSLLHLLA